MARRLSDGRLHLQHWPIDLVILGSEAEYARAQARFATVLEELVAELPLLRAPVGEAYPLARGRVARRTVAAVWRHRAVFVTPMAAVAGAVADEILEAMQPAGKAYVNDGGDIAVHLPPGESFDAGIVDNPLKSYPERDWERAYRNIFAHDHTFVFLCAPNDTHNCLLKAYVKNGIVVRIGPTHGYGKAQDLYGNTASHRWDPRLCQKGLALVRRIYGDRQ